MNTPVPLASHKSTEPTVCLQQGKIKDDFREQDSLIAMKLELENKYSIDVLYLFSNNIIIILVSWHTDEGMRLKLQQGKEEDKLEGCEEQSAGLDCLGKGWRLCRWRPHMDVSGTVQMELILPWGWIRPPEVPSETIFSDFQCLDIII